MIDYPQGDYSFLRGIGPYSSGGRAAPGFEVVHAVFQPLAPLEEGYERIREHLESRERPIQALCGMELRIPRALSIEAFGEFNQPYIERLKSWGMFRGEMNPVARTNVAPETPRIEQPSVHGFSYTIESTYTGPTLVVAGAGELRSSELEASEIVRRGDCSKEGLIEKAETVLEIMTERLRGLDVDWSAVTAVDVYCVHDIHPIMESTILPRLAGVSHGGIHWFYARPPVVEIDFEMDVRAVRREIVLAG